MFPTFVENRGTYKYSLFADKKSDDSLKLFPKHVGPFQVKYDLENLRLSFVDVQECDVSGGVLLVAPNAKYV